MRIITSSDRQAEKQDSAIQAVVDNIDQSYLEKLVENISIPRHRIKEQVNNEKVAAYIQQEFLDCGLKIKRQGEFNNIIACRSGELDDCQLIIGAHYDSVPGSPGADDNASAVAGMLATARALANETNKVAFIAFNAEEDGLLGSTDFVNNYLVNRKHNIKLVHILEMIAFTNKEKGSQSLPPGLPVKIRDIGDFLAIVANRHSNTFVPSLLQTVADYTPQLQVTALEVFLGIEKLVPHLLRSDHSPFWAQDIPAFMWTDTSEFRNPHYHKASDLPHTLDYNFLLQVTQLLSAHALLFTRE